MHISFIMDGNGRWARERNMPRTFGHKEGAKALQRLIPALANQGVREATFYAFSTENWKRPQREVRLLMNLFEDYLKSQIQKIHENNGVFRVIGRRDRLSSKAIQLIEQSELLTEKNTGIRINIAVDYGGKSEIVSAVRSIAREVMRGEISVDDIDEQMLENGLMLKTSPDMMIRTGGEKRLSNYLLWQHAYSEFLFLDVLWPDFDEEILADCIRQFRARNRRFGGL